MNASYRSILFLMLCCFSGLVLSQYYEDPEGLDQQISRINENERSCKYRWKQGLCRRQSECSRPTRQVCRSGLDPIVCCLDKDQHEQTRIITRFRRQQPSYPGCGFRSPKIQGNRAKISNNRGRGRNLISQRANSSSDGFPMIVGGNAAQKNSWPWQVAVYKEGNLYCGASLISQNYALSAAHCFHGDGLTMKTDPSRYFVVIGKHTRNDGIQYPARRILIHPGYKRPQFYHDIALIALGRRVELSKKVYPVCLPSDGMTDQIERDNSIVTVTGWGDIKYGGGRKDELQELTLPIVPLRVCSVAYSRERTSYPQGLSKQQICAGLQQGGKGACHGDSGGPLVSKLKDNSYVQLGVVSFGYKCAEPRYPTIYTRVSQYTKWIYDNTDLGK